MFSFLNNKNVAYINYNIFNKKKVGVLCSFKYKELIKIKNKYDIYVLKLLWIVEVFRIFLAISISLVFGRRFALKMDFVLSPKSQKLKT